MALSKQQLRPSAEVCWPKGRWAHRQSGPGERQTGWVAQTTEKRGEQGWVVLAEGHDRGTRKEKGRKRLRGGGLHCCCS